ncbi:hypothetical protein [Pimelobacter sp. 30-1]|uniref:hypothetical protein n=1 Tax=Pimelobacter sp. 30-1 TaxID=2004991 RepID=UPI001C03B639|nr:hypothetical protein [Pimelobacter sp. 30-1]MBU2696045.1 hypothetical protein [Pimelobacter sp. 30-1]
MTWYGVRTVCRFAGSGDVPPHYEERVVIFEADDFAGAIAQAEAEAAEYAAIFDDCEALGLVQSYEMADPIGAGAEVYSLMRTSDLEPDDYLDRFFDTGEERQRAL